MNRRTLLKTILAIPFLAKLSGQQAEGKIKNNIIRRPDFKKTLDKEIHSKKSGYIKLTTYCSQAAYNRDFLYEGQYVIFTLWHVNTKKGDFNYLLKEIRPAKSWDDVKQSCKNNTFAGVVRKKTRCPGLVEIYASKLSIEELKNCPFCFYDAESMCNEN